MKVVQQIALINKIATELERQYDGFDISLFLEKMNAKDYDFNEEYQGKFNYIKSNISDKKLDLLMRMAEELEISSAQINSYSIPQPEIWSETINFRIFISHLAKDKSIAHKLKDALSKYNISGFVAHDDIKPTKSWQDEIERSLHHMDALLAIHTSGFKDSFWAQQEIGFALGRGIKVISFKFEEDPVGFISKNQAILRNQRKAEAISEEINGILLADSLTKGRMLEAKNANSSTDDDIPF